MKGARLNDSNFRYAQAYRVFLANAHLLHAKLQGAFLSQADLRGADLVPGLMPSIPVPAGSAEVAATAIERGKARRKRARHQRGVGENAAFNNSRREAMGG